MVNHCCYDVWNGYYGNLVNNAAAYQTKNIWGLGGNSFYVGEWSEVLSDSVFEAVV